MRHATWPLCVVIINPTTNRTNDRSHGHEHEHGPEVIDSFGDEHSYNGHGGLVKAHGGVVIAAPAIEVAIQWMVNVNVAVIVANESTSGCGQW